MSEKKSGSTPSPSNSLFGKRKLCLDNCRPYCYWPRAYIDGQVVKATIRMFLATNEVYSFRRITLAPY